MRDPLTDTEINELVAKRLGWIIDKISDYRPWYGRPNGRPESGMVRELPDFCHDIKAAWEVVEWMQKKFDYVEVIGADKDTNGIWSCGARNLTIWQTWESADSAPRAICEAFLKLNQVT